MEYTSSSVAQTHELAQHLVKDLNHNLICLYGELGSGKTTFVQGMAKALGIKKRLLSPTFILVREYRIKNSQLPITNYQLLFHVDCYRIASAKDIKSVDLAELWSDPNNLVVIEWAQRLQKILPNRRIDIKFSYEAQNKRKIEIIHR